MEAILEVMGIDKSFGTTKALDDAHLEVFEREIVAILGPSGCGKSTLLRVVAGLEQPDDGRIRWAGRDITDLDVHRRHFGLMFQSYALFPHRSVGQNVAFGLRMLELEEDEVQRRTTEALTWVGMDEYSGRPIEGLSGGEQQRVALARTLAPAPALVMLDEPLGALDRRLRERLVNEVGTLLREREATALYVTHDHDEAETVSDRVVIMRAGRVIQTGTLAEIRAHPVDEWVSEFVG